MLFNLKRKHDKRFMVIGIDGVPFELLDRFAKEGIMPNVAKLKEKHRFIPSRVPMPEISSVSWTSFMTGMNPGENGVYGFMELNPVNYSYIFPNFKTLPVRAMWEDLGERDKRSVIINLPGTYPARPMKGVLVSGFVALDLDRAVFPMSQLPVLKKMNYQVDPDASQAAQEKDKFLKTMLETLDIRYDYYKKIEKKEDWDLCYFIITETDRLHHFYFDALDDRRSSYFQAFRDFYSKIDEIIGEITRRMEKKGIPFIILSDHGFTKIKQEVYLSQYLKEWGYLEFEDPKPKDLVSISRKSPVFALDPSRLYIHLEGKFRKGCVKKSEYESLREEVKTRFLSLEIDGEKVIRSVYFKEEIYNGKYLDKAPDLVLLSNYGYDLKAGITKDRLYNKTFFEGMHTQDNALLIDSFGLDLETHPFIYDIGKQISAYFN